MAGKYKGEEYVQNYESVPVQLFSTFTSIEFQHKLWQKITQTFEPQLTWITTDLTIELKWISIDLWEYCWIFFPFRAVGDSINSVHKMCTNTDYRNGESVKNNTNTNNTNTDYRNGELYSIRSKGSLSKKRSQSIWHFPCWVHLTSARRFLMFDLNHFCHHWCHVFYEQNLILCHIKTQKATTIEEYNERISLVTTLNTNHGI